MIVKINARGHSFKGVAAYLMHGPRGAEDAGRVGFSESVNLMGADPEEAARYMAFTDMTRDQSGPGRKASAGAVYHYSLSWAQDEQPDEGHMRAAALATVERLGLADHQFFMVSHTDRDHAHIHVVANLTHPETGKRASLKYDKRALQKWAGEYEQQHGIKCEARAKNAAAFEAGKSTKHGDERQDYAQQITAAWTAADNGRAFVHALREQGLELGRGRRGSGFVIVDGQGEIQKLARQLQIQERGKAKTEAIRGKLSDLQANDVADGDDIARRIKTGLEAASREGMDAARQNKMLDAAEEHARKIAAQEQAAERRAAALERKREAELSGRLEKMELRHEQERTALEAQLSEGVGRHVAQVKGQAEALRQTVEGRGLGKSLRRLWRGRQDRDDLAGMRRQIDQLETSIADARAAVDAIHAQERADLIRQHEQARYDFKARPAEEQIAYLQKAAQADREKKQRFGMDRPGLLANDPTQRRLHNQVLAIRQAEQEKAKAAETARQQAAERPAFVKRQQEIEAQQRPQKSAADRIREQAEAFKEKQADKSKDQGYEP